MKICLLYDGFFSFAVVRQIQVCLLLMGCVSLSLCELSVVNRIIKGFIQFLVRSIIANVNGLAILLCNINSRFRNHILGGRDHGVGIAFAVVFRI